MSDSTPTPQETLYTPTPPTDRAAIAERTRRKVLTAFDEAVASLSTPNDAVELWRFWRRGLTLALGPVERDAAWVRLTRRVHALWAQTHTSVWLKKGVAIADASEVVAPDDGETPGTVAR